MPKNVSPSNLGGYKATNAADGTAATDLVTKQQLDALPSIAATIAQDPWHSIGAVGEPAFIPGNISNYPGNFGPVKFRKTPDGRVEMTGMITSSTSVTGASTLFQLPVGYRPATGVVVELFKCPTDTGHMRVDISASGDVAVNSGGSIGAGGYLSFAGVSFDTNATSAIASAASVSQEGWHTVGAVGEPAFVNSWTGTLRFRKDPAGNVSIDSSATGISGGATGTNAFVLPVGYRPATLQQMSILLTGGAAGGILTIDTSGNVAVYRSTAVAAFINISFNVGQTTWPAGTTQPIPLVSALPVSPLEGNEIYFQNSGMLALGVRHHLVYNSAGSTYKWEADNGSPLYTQTAAGGGPTSMTGGATWNNAPTTQTDVTVALAGDYEVEGTVTILSSAASLVKMGVAAGITGTPAFPVVTTQNFTAAQTQTISVNGIMTGLTAGTVLRLRYNVGTTTNMTITNSVLKARPIRVG